MAVVRADLADRAAAFEHGAAKLIDAVAPDAMDDRALVLLWRT